MVVYAQRRITPDMRSDRMRNRCHYTPDRPSDMLPPFVSFLTLAGYE